MSLVGGWEAKLFHKFDLHYLPPGYVSWVGRHEDGLELQELGDVEQAGEEDQKADVAPTLAGAALSR